MIIQTNTTQKEATVNVHLITFNNVLGQNQLHLKLFLQRKKNAVKLNIFRL